MVKSTRFEGNFAKEGDRFRMVGEVTIRDTTMEITLDSEFSGRGQDPWGTSGQGSRRAASSTGANGGCDGLR